MSKRDIIVIGASAGGSEAIRELCQWLPPDFPASVFIVWHLGSGSSGYFPKMISKVSKLPVKNAENGEKFKPGHIYIAPPNKHLLLEKEITRTTIGPKENRFRPAIDPLFRSAAFNYKERVIGVILSGLLNDGTSGLWNVKDCGGITIVQDPDEALFNSMPKDAVKNVEVDYIKPVKEIASLLMDLTSENVTAKADVNIGLQYEVELALGKLKGINKMDKIGEITGYTCPECHGALWEINNGKPVRFRCHTGHAYTLEYLIDHLEETMEMYMWNLIRGTEEFEKLLQEISKNTSENEKDKNEHIQKIKNAQNRIKILKSLTDIGKTDNANG